MKKFAILALLYAGIACAQQSPPYPTGIWMGSLVDPVTVTAQNVTLYVLPNGTFWGTVLVFPQGGAGEGGCPFLIVGNLVKGGVGVVPSAVKGSPTGPVPSSCNDSSVWGGSQITLTTPTTAQWSLKTTILKHVYNLTLTTSLYDQPSSFKAIAGYWNDPNTGYTEIVTPTGASMSYNPILGCIGSGKYTLIDVNHNLYSFAETLYDCDSAVFNGARNGVAFVQKLFEGAGGTVLTNQTSAGLTGLVEASDGLLYYGH